MPVIPEILKHCFRCRRETLHRHVGTVSGHSLYACSISCGAPHREVTDAEKSTPAYRSMVAATEAAQKLSWKREQDAEGPVPSYPELRAAFDRADVEIRAAERTVVAAPSHRRNVMPDTKPMLIQTIEKTVNELLDARPAQLSAEDIREIVRTELAAQLGLEAAAAASTRSSADTEPCRHKNFMRKCESCQSRKAAK